MESIIIACKRNYYLNGYNVVGLWLTPQSKIRLDNQLTIKSSAKDGTESRE